MVELVQNVPLIQFSFLKIRNVIIVRENIPLILGIVLASITVLLTLVRDTREGRRS